MKTNSLRLLVVILSFIVLTLTSFTEPLPASASFNQLPAGFNGELPKNWRVKRVLPEMENIPGLGKRTVAIFISDDMEIKAYCINPGLPIPPAGTKCVLDATNTFQCGIFQRFKPIPTQPTPTPTPSPTPIPFSCEQLGLGLQVKYKYPGKSETVTKVNAFLLPTREFTLEPLAVAPDEIWNPNPIHMFSPGKTCAAFTVFGEVTDLPPEVKKVEVLIECPGLRRDLSAEAADGNYCFGCKEILYTQKICTVVNKLYVERLDQTYVCQAFYKVTDPPLP